MEPQQNKGKSVNALLHSCCTKAPMRSGASFLASCFSCKPRGFRGGPDETRTRDLRHAKATLAEMAALVSRVVSKGLEFL